jgi:hypothetical protein
MFTVTLEIDAPQIGSPDAIGVALGVSGALITGLGERGYVVHRIDVERVDA